MASPIAHTLVGLTLGAAAFLPHGSGGEMLGAVRRRWRGLLGCGVLSNAPDVDYLFGLFTGHFNAYHQYHTHTVGFVGAVVLGVWGMWMRRVPGPAAGRLVFLAVVAFSHLLIDLVSGDTGAPYGIMALWPFTAERIYWPDAAIFLDLDKRGLFNPHNVRVGVRELLITLPPLLGVLAWKRLPLARWGRALR